jgi:hypothetical protein
VARWFGTDGNRYSKSCGTRKEAERFTESKQQEVREGKADPPDEISLDGFIAEHGRVMRGQIAPYSLYDQLRALALFKEHIGSRLRLQDIKPPRYLVWVM